MLLNVPTENRHPHHQWDGHHQLCRIEPPFIWDSPSLRAHPESSVKVTFTKESYINFEVSLLEKNESAR